MAESIFNQGEAYDLTLGSLPADLQAEALKSNWTQEQLDMARRSGLAALGVWLKGRIGNS